MKLLNIKINNTINCVYNFDNPNRYPRTYVIDNVSNDPILFSLPTSNKNGNLTFTIITETGNRATEILSIKEEENTIDGKKPDFISRTKTITLFERDYFQNTITPEQKAEIEKKVKEYKDNIDKGILGKVLDFTSRGEFYCSARANQIVEYSVKIILASISRLGDINEESCSFKIVLCPTRNAYQATLDFGSEASQAILYNCADGRISCNNILRMFYELGQTLKKSIDTSDYESSKNIEYIQYDKDERLFRSHFFAKKVFQSNDAVNSEKVVDKEINPNDNSNGVISTDASQSEPQKGECNKGDTYDPTINPKDNPHLHIMNTTHEIDLLKKDYFTLPNVKIACLSHDRPLVTVKYADGEDSQDATRFKNRYFYRSAINAFVFQILKKISGEARANDIIAYLRLTVLMPNVYNQKELSERLKDLNEDVERMLKQDAFARIRGVEINAISESDASILGCMNSDNELALKLNKGNYLIIDAGKGTLDLSVLKYDPHPQNNQNYVSLYRSGIVGSGNAITYAVFLDLMKQMLATTYSVPQEDLVSGIKSIIRHLIMPGDEAALAELLKYLECYKQRIGECYPVDIVEEFSDKNTIDDIARDKESTCTFSFDTKSSSIIISRKVNGKNSNKNSNDTDSKNSINLQTDIVEWVKNLFKDPLDPYSSRITGIDSIDLSFTWNMIKSLVDDALKSFGYSGEINHIILSGRAFYMPQFKNAILNGIKNRYERYGKKVWEKAQEVQWDNKGKDINSKNICLFVNNMFTPGKYDGRVVGRPVLKKHGEDPRLYKTVEEKAALHGLAKFLKKKNCKKWTVDLTASISKIVSNALGRLKYVFLWAFADKQQATTMRDIDYSMGIPVDISSTDDRIAISGTYYSLPENARVGERATIYFDGYEFLFKSGRVARPFAPAVSPSTLHVFESTFPYGRTRTENIPIPLRPTSSTSRTEKPSEEMKGNEPNAVSSEKNTIFDDITNDL